MQKIRKLLEHNKFDQIFEKDRKTIFTSLRNTFLFEKKEEILTVLDETFNLLKIPKSKREFLVKKVFQDDNSVFFTYCYDIIS